jgi:dTMP kinase
MVITQSHSGVLVAVEGLDGSGKSTQLSLLYQWLTQKYSCVVLTEWNSSPVLREIIRREKKAKRLSPNLFSTLHCADFAER